MSDHLSRRGSAGGKTGPEDDIVQPAFQELQQELARQTALSRRPFTVNPELLFQDTVNAPKLLLFPELKRIIRYFRPPLAVLTGRVVPALDRTFGRVAPLAFEIELLAFSSAKLTTWSRISCHQLSFALSDPNHFPRAEFTPSDVSAGGSHCEGSASHP